MISPSAPEPICDVRAQLAALTDPAHPKDAVWLAAGTREVPADAIRVSSSAGVLFTTNERKAASFLAAPSDETLASVLGYPEVKWHVRSPFVVVQAFDASGCVVTEMLASMDALGGSAAVASRHGAVKVTTLPDALTRRMILVRLGV